MNLTRRGQVSIPAGLLVAALAVLGTAACGEDETPPAATPTATAGPTGTAAAAVVTWAGEVCSGVDGLRASLTEFASVIPVEPGGDPAAREQVRTEVERRTAAVQEDVTALRGTIDELPPEADPAVAAAKDQLATSSAQVQTQIDGLATAAEQVAAATTPEAVDAAMTPLRQALLAVGTSIATYADEVRRVTSGAGDAVRAAFAAAPDCQKIPSS